VSLRKSTQKIRAVIFYVFLNFGIFSFLTALTQVGGLVYLVSLLVAILTSTTPARRTLVFIFLFTAGYGVASIGAQYGASRYGRVPLPCFKTETAVLAMQSPLFCILNRHYVRKDLARIATDLGNHINEEFPGTVTLALDGNFPLFENFAMLPHLSHNDGRKLDLAFFYKDRENRYLRGRTKSPIGYWGFEREPGDRKLCADTSYWCWDMAWFQVFVSDLDIEAERTRAAVKWLYTEGRKLGVEKIFLEPYLAKQLSLKSDILRYQGRNAARHDDHIHFQTH